MKKGLLGIAAAAVLTVSAMTFSAGAADPVKIDEKNFPDDIFRAYVQIHYMRTGID